MGLGNRLILLHDGRAAGGSFADRVTSAIGWHGPFGEGSDSAAAFDSQVEPRQFIVWPDL